MFVFLGHVRAPGRGGKIILEFQRSLLDKNSENCRHVEKNKRFKNLEIWLRSFTGGNVSSVNYKDNKEEYSKEIKILLSGEKKRTFMKISSLKLKII